jgi:hypothetical protein
VRVDRFPALMHAGAAAAVLLELTFGVAVWSRRLRMAALAAALVFHAFARVLMGIDFSGLWLTYVVFVDWDRLLAACRSPPSRLGRRFGGWRRRWRSAWCWSRARPRRARAA